MHFFDIKKLGKVAPFLMFVVIFRNWLVSPVLVALDWPYFFRETLEDFSFLPPVWNPAEANSLGGVTLFYALDSYIHGLGWLFVNTLGLRWELVLRMFIFGAIVVLSIVSITSLLKTIEKGVTHFQVLIASLLYGANTYILMLVGGGQVGMSLGYAVAPLVLARFIKDFERERLSVSACITTGFVVALQILFDIRIALVTAAVVVLWTMYARTHWRRVLPCLVIPTVVSLGLHAYWILPMVLLRSLPTDQLVWDSRSVGLYQFLSFGSFSQTLSLLHPNWPENIFGKVYFMRPEFLGLPLLAFASLLFVKKKSPIVFFSVLGLVGAFLAKGSQPPLGEINTWLFVHIPGFFLFRDSTKWYILTAISYSILIPLVVHEILKRKLLPRACAGLVLIYLVFLLSPAIKGELGGTFAPRELPKEYQDLKDFLHAKPEFFRTLWVPRQQKFNYYSYRHPAMSAETLFGLATAAQLLSRFTDPSNREHIRSLGIRYVIVPSDPLVEIFVEDRKYSDRERQRHVRALDSVEWLTRVSSFSGVAVYDAGEWADHFSFPDTGNTNTLSYRVISPSRYALTVTVEHPGLLVLSESFSPNWQARIGDDLVPSQPYRYNLNSFMLTRTGTYAVDVTFSGEMVYTYGRYVSLAVLVATMVIVVRKKRYEK